MKKRLFSLLLVVAVVLMAAPVAMADHCVTCKSGQCAIAFSGGYLSCTQLANGCSLSGSCGGPHPLIEEEYFNSEFVVASVERLDEPRQPSSEATRVASLETAPQTAER